MNNIQLITANSLLYKSDVEYADHCINHVRGCAHGCKFPCYAFNLAKRRGICKSYEEWLEPKLIANAPELLAKELPKMKDKIKSVHFSFTTDPFMYGYPEIEIMTLELMKRVNNAGIKCTALTKGILPIELAELSKKNEIGITLISLDERFRQKFEPNTAPFEERIEALYQLHLKGVKTMISMEPYPTPNMVEKHLGKILQEIGFVDKIIFGRWNYNKEVSSYPGCKEFFNDAARQVIEFCEDYCIDYHIKDGTITHAAAS